MNLSTWQRLRGVVEPDPPEARHMHMTYSSAQMKQKIQLRQLSILKHRTTAVVAIRMLLILIFSLICWQYIGGWVLGIWLAFSLMHTLASMKSADDFFNESNPEKRFKFWKERTLQMTLVSGLSIGFAGFYFMIPDNALVQMVLLALIVGITFGSIPLYAVWIPALWAFVPFTLLPAIVKLVIIYDHSWGIATLWTAVLFVIIFYFGLRLNSIFMQGIYRSFEREYLVEQLIYQRQKADYVREAAEMEIMSRTRFFAAANHDLRQPLQAMGIFISLLEGQATEQTKPLIENLSKACTTVSTLVDQILMISKLESKSIKINKSEFSVRELFAEFEQEFKPMAAAKGVGFEVRAPEVMIETDLQLFERIIRNLLGNAVRYTTKGKILLRAKALRRGILSVTVSDTGCGITKKDREKLFQPYFRGEGGHRAKEGFGLGLSIVKKIADLLGMDIQVLSRVGRGSIFRLTVPIIHSSQESRTSASRPVAKIMPLEGFHVLVIEDDPLIRKSLETLIEGWGAKVRAAEYYDAELAAEVVNHPRIDLIFSDFNLGPGRMTGLQSIFRLRSVLGKKIPAIVSTAAPRDAVLSQYEEETEGMDFSDSAVNLMELPLIIQKPVSPLEINRAIYRQLRKDVSTQSSEKLAGAPAEASAALKDTEQNS